MLILAINQSSKAHLLTAELLAAIEEVVLTKISASLFSEVREYGKNLLNLRSCVLKDNVSV